MLIDDYHCLGFCFISGSSPPCFRCDASTELWVCIPVSSTVLKRKEQNGVNMNNNNNNL